MTSGSAETVRAKYFDGRHPITKPAEVRVVEGTFCLSYWQHPSDQNAIEVNHPLGAVRVTPRIGDADRFVSVPGGAQLQCQDAIWLDALPQERGATGLVGWLDRSASAAVVAILVVVMVLAGAYRWGVPALGDLGARAMSAEREVKLGRATLTSLDGVDLLFEGSRLALAKQTAIRKRFAKLVAGLSMAHHYRLEFRNSPESGPNAFALPGAIVVVTDQLVEICSSEDAVVGVLAHEVGHVEHHHPLRGLLRESGLGMLGAALTGDMSGISTAATALPRAMGEVGYSRDFEREADDYAFRLLGQQGLSPLVLAEALEAIALAVDAEGMEEDWAYLSTHPATTERIARARSAASR